MKRLTFEKRGQVWIVRNQDHSEIATIYFYNRWNRYVLDCYRDVVFDMDCLQEVIDFVRGLN